MASIIILYVVAGIVTLAVIGLITFFIIRSKNKKIEEGIPQVKGGLDENGRTSPEETSRQTKEDTGSSRSTERRSSIFSRFIGTKSQNRQSDSSGQQPESGIGRGESISKIDDTNDESKRNIESRQRVQVSDSSRNREDDNANGEDDDSIELTKPTSI